MTLLARLKDYRQLRSAVDKVPIYCIFGDTVIAAIAETRPRSMEALLTIRGMTPEKCGEYGKDLLCLVQSVGPEISAGSPFIQDIVMRHSGSKGHDRGEGDGCSARPSSGGRRRGVKRTLAKYLAARAPCITMPRGTGPALSGGYAAYQSPAGAEDDVYVLELAQGRVYVGRTSNWRRRLMQHFTGHGSAFTQAFPPTGTLLPRLGHVTGCAEAAERDETLRYMYLRGIQVVRGWKYTRVTMSEDEHADAEENIRELFDLCRRCGCPGHFISQCRASFDRLGRPCT